MTEVHERTRSTTIDVHDPRTVRGIHGSQYPCVLSSDPIGFRNVLLQIMEVSLNAFMSKPVWQTSTSRCAASRELYEMVEPHSQTCCGEKFQWSQPHRSYQKDVRNLLRFNAIILHMLKTRRSRFRLSKLVSTGSMPRGRFLFGRDPSILVTESRMEQGPHTLSIGFSMW